MRSDFLALQTPLLTTGYTPRHTYTHTSLFPLGTHPPTHTRFCYHWVYIHPGTHTPTRLCFHWVYTHLHPHVFVSTGYTPSCTYTHTSLLSTGYTPVPSQPTPTPTPTRLCFHRVYTQPHLHPHVFLSSHTYTHTFLFPPTPTPAPFLSLSRTVSYCQLTQPSDSA